MAAAQPAREAGRTPPNASPTPVGPQPKAQAGQTGGHAAGPEPTHGSDLAPVQRRADWWPSPQLPSHSLRRSGRPARPHALAADRSRVTHALPILSPSISLYFFLDKATEGGAYQHGLIATDGGRRLLSPSPFIVGG